MKSHTAGVLAHIRQGTNGEAHFSQLPFAISDGSAVGVVLMREKWRHLWMVPVYRIVYEPLRAYLLYTAVYMAVRGVRAGWKKLARTGTLDAGLLMVHEPEQNAIAAAGASER